MAAGKILFAGLMVAAGIFAPAVTASAGAGSAYFIQGVLTTAGSVGLSVATKLRESSKRRRLREPAALLSNHDLQVLVAYALQQAFKLAALEKSLRRWSREIRWLGEAAHKYLDGAQTSAAGVGLPSIVDRYAAALDRRSPAADLELTDWNEVVEALAVLAKTQAIPEPQKRELAQHVAKTFERFVIEVFKEDATGKGPAEGKGWAALELLFWGLLRAEMADMAENLADAQEARRETQESVEALDAKLDQMLRWHGPEIVDGEPELQVLLGGMQQDLQQRLDAITDLLSHGLLTPHEFETDYWRERRDDPGSEELWANPDRALALVSSVVGREAEIRDFERFLDERSPWVVHVHGYPGAGKSRLMLAFAKRAVEMGRRVYFVGRNVHDLGAALKRATDGAPMVLLWDDYRGDNPEALRVFLSPDGLPGPVIKRVITSWPTVDPLGERVREAHFAKQPLGPIEPTQALSDYTNELLPRISDEEAAHIVNLSEGYPQAVLQAAEQVLRGAAPRRLPRNLLEEAYDNLIKRAIEKTGLDADVVRRTLLVLALVGRVDYGQARERDAFERAEIPAATLGKLAEVDLLAHEGQTFALQLDGFRAHVVRRALDYARPELLSGTPELVAAQAAPFLEEWIDAIWGVCVLATGGAQPTALREPLQQALLESLEKVHEEQ